MSNQKYSIRIAEIKDAPALVHMALDYLREAEGKELTEQDKAGVASSILRGMATQAVIILIAERPKKRGLVEEIGYSVFDIRDNIYGRLIAWGHHIYVKPEHRGGNVAVSMIKLAEALSLSLGAVEAYIDTARPALFKRKFGYKDKYVVVSKRLGGNE